MSDEKSIYHQHGDGNEGNIKFVSGNGRRERVFNRLDQPVTSPENMGTYNYTSPYESTIGHGVDDVVPYWRWGNTPEDKTPWTNRMFGPSSDKTFRFGEEP